MSISAGVVEAIWRYPVKSMAGECLRQAAFDEHGLVGDRRFAFASSSRPVGKPMVASHERTALLRYRARSLQDGTVRADTPDGATFELHDPALLVELGERTRREARPAPAFALQSSVKPYTDVRPVALIARATLDRLSQEFGEPLDAQRFRSNLILDLGEEPLAERGLIGRVYRLGHEKTGPTIVVTEAIPRCRIVSLAPATAESDPRLLRFLAQQYDGKVGVYASVLQPGPFQVGSLLFQIR